MFRSVNLNKSDSFIKRSFVIVLVFLSPNFFYPQELTSFGLDGIIVNDIKYASDYLFAATNSGVYKRFLNNSDSDWVHIGLDGKIVNTLYPHFINAKDLILIAGIAPDFNQGDSTLIYEYLNSNWIEADNGIPPSPGASIKTIDGISDGNVFSALYDGKLYRKEFNGLYKEILNIGFGVMNVVRANKNSGDIFVGGETGIFAPYIFKSTDSGNSWYHFSPDLDGDNACNSILFDPNDSDIAYAGMEGVVLKTNNSGITWERTSLDSTPYYFYALEYNSAQNILFAGGFAWPNDFGLYYSFDAANQWTQFHPKKDYKGVSSMVIAGTETNLYLATYGDGVLKLKMPATNINDKNITNYKFELFQNFPNPFNPSTKISYQLKSAGFVSLKVYNVLGNEVDVLIEKEQPAGFYEVVLDAGDYASGIYFCRLNVDGFIQTRKMTLIR